MCRDIERQDVDEGHIPGTKIEPQRPLLDTLGLTHMEAERGLGRVTGITRGKLDSVRIIGDGYNLSRVYE